MKKLFCLILISFCLVACSNNQVPNDTGNTNEEIKNEEVDLVSLELINYKSTFNGNEEFSVGNLVVNGIYSDTSKKVITDYVVDSTNYNKSEKGTYTIIVTYSGVSNSYNVKVISESGEEDLPLV